MPWIAKTHSVSPSWLQDELAQYEKQFGVPSERLIEAFVVDGALVETPDFLRWSRLYTASAGTVAV